MTRWTHVLLPLLLAASAAPAAGQQPTQPPRPAAGTVGTVTGQVVAVENRTPIVGAQVLVVGTQIGAVAAADGRFILRNVPAGAQTLRVQFIGFAPSTQAVTVTAGGSTAVTVELKDLPYQVAATVVTALGVTRSEKSLGYAVQTVTAQALERTPETTLIQALAGQSAGVSITSSSGRPGAPARIVFRGETSFSGNTQPLFVIDGVPVSTNSDSPSNALGTGSSNSRQADIDMENVEQITMLRGAAATALYGSRAANGAVIIKTKSGRQGEPLRFNYSVEGRLDRPIIQGYQTNYTAGSRGYFCNGKLPSQGGWCEPGYPGTNSETTNSWGPHKDSIPQIVFDSMGTIRFRDARADFYRTAPMVNTSLRGSGSMGDRGTYTLGGSYLDQRGVNPIAKLAKLNLNANILLNLTRALTSTTSIQRIRTDNPYSDDSFSGIDKLLVDIPATTDVRTGYLPDGSPYLLGTNRPSFQWLAANERNTELTNRWIASQQFGYKIGGGFQLRNNWGLDTYVTEYGRYFNERPWQTAVGVASGSTQQRKTTRTSINDDLQLLMDTKELGRGISFNALVGGNLLMQDASFVQGAGSTIVIPNYFNLSNFATQTTSANLPTKRRLLGAYVSSTTDYNDWAFLELTGRNDWSSTLPTTQNSYFYPSAALSVVLTDALKWHPKALSYAKLRLSKAKAGNDAPAYALSTRYVTGTLAKGASNDQQQNGGPSIQFPFRGIPAYTQSTQLGNPELRPESTVEEELGLELRFFESRVRSEVSVYRKSSYDQIFSVPSSAVTGYTSILRNAGNLRNNGVEVTLRARPLEIGRSFSWDVGVNWARNRSKVLSLAPGVTSLSLAGYSWPQIRIMDGQPYGVIWGYGWKKNCVAADPCFQSQPAGTLLIDNNGLPIKSDELRDLGTVMPNWIGSINSQINFKGFQLSGLVDSRNGGKIINFETQYEVSNGRSVLTETRNTYVTHEGINSTTGQPNTVRVLRNQDYYGLIYGQDRHEAQIEPAGYVKLREVTLAYRVPDRLIRRIGLQNASAYVTGRNLAVWSDFSLGDPEGDVYGGQNAGGLYFRQFPEPQTRSLVTGIRTMF